MSIAPIFVTAKNLETAQIPLMEYDPAIKMNELLVHATTRMTCQGTMLSEKNQSQKVTYSMISFM